MKYKTIPTLLSILLVILLFSGCKKYLDPKPDIKLATLSRLSDLEALLDYYPTINNVGYSAEASADNYYVNLADWQAVSDVQQRIHTWQPDNLYSPEANEWYNLYRTVYYANSVLEGLGEIAIAPGTEQQRNELKGQALMIRGLSFYNIASIWANAYDVTTAPAALGIPLRLSTDFNQPSSRASLAESYERIILDLKESIGLLPIIPVAASRASKPAAYAYLSRIYLSMRNYPAAKLYADSCLQLKNTLMNYNDITIAVYPFPAMNKEILFDQAGGSAITSNSRAKVDTNLYHSYEVNDLRRTLFFTLNPDGSAAFHGQYMGYDALFLGAAVDEIYLNRAECLARAGNVPDAMADLNTLLITRYKTNFFVPFTAANAPDALNIIMLERRKELLMRGLRWTDIKRLNKEGANINLKRILGNDVYTLPANDLRFALPLPEDIIVTTGMPQNPR